MAAPSGVGTGRARGRRVRLKLLVAEPADHRRPMHRSECENGPRPCPYVGCMYNLYLDVGRRGSIRLTAPSKEPDEVAPSGSCALDLAERGGMTLDEIAEVMGGVTHEAIRKVEQSAMQRILRRAAPVLRAILLEMLEGDR